jgi:hypothetical protein
MKYFNTIAAQGDLMLRKIQNLPEGTELIPNDPTNGKYVVAHSETGHHHVIDAEPRVKWYQPKTKFTDLDMLSYLEILDDEADAANMSPVLLKHERSFDTHETIALTPGLYEIRRQREYTPNGFRKAID